MGVWCTTSVGAAERQLVQCLHIANNAGAAGKAKHELCRYLVVQRHVESDDVYNRHVEDELNFTDFLTKWVSWKKIKASVELITNSRNAVAVRRGE